MYFRVTSQTSSNEAIRFVSAHNANIIDFQKQISSGLRLDQSSDDPVAFRQVTSLSTRLRELETDSFAILDAETKLNTSVSNIQQAHELVVRAKTLAQQGVQSNSASERNALAVEVEGMLTGLKDISLSTTAGSFLYGGSRSDQLPYEFGPPSVEGGTIAAQYQGASESSRAFIGTAIVVETFYSGEEIFGRSERGELVVQGNTGARNGRGTDSMIARANLHVRHDETIYDPGSGVIPGSRSAQEDTVIGGPGENQITVRDLSGTGAFGTVTFNNGTEVEWTQSDVDLKVTDDLGRDIFLDMSAINAGFDGSVSFESSGTLSVDGGLTEVPIDFSESQTLIDSTTGGQVHIDTQDITRAGVDFLEFPGTSNVFQVFHELASDLRNTRDLDTEAYAASLDRRLGELDKLADNMLDTLGKQSASLQSLDELEIRVQNLQLEVETQVNNFQATDIPETVLRLQNEQSLLEFTYSVTAQIASTSILNFLR